MTKSNTVVITSFDEKIFKQSTVFIKTFCENYQEELDIDLYCLVPPELMDKESTFIKYLGNTDKVSVKFIYSEKWVKFVKDGIFSANDHITLNVWQRLFISSLFPNHNKAIYIDSDTMVMRDVSPLINYKSNAKMIAKIEISDAAWPTFKTIDRLYFNAGVFITDLSYWRENNLESKMIDYVIKNGVTKYMEQDVLNIFFENNIDHLPETMNFGAWSHEFKTLKEIVTDPMIVHWYGAKKPWSFNKKYKQDPFELQWREKYKKITGEYSFSFMQNQIEEKNKMQELEYASNTNRPRYDKTCYVTATDANYFDYTCVIVKTFCENYHGDEVLDYFVLVPKEIMDRENEFLKIIGDTGNVIVKFANSEKYEKLYKDLTESGKNFFAGALIENNSSWINLTVFHRIFLSSLFPEYGRGVYMDSDMIILRDVDPIVKYPMVNKMMAKIEHGLASQLAFGEIDWTYFNAGFFITDLNYWRENNIEDKVIELATQMEGFNWAEQDILNILFRYNFHALPETFNFMNWQVRHQPEFIGLYKDPLVVHFAGPNKPWHTQERYTNYESIWRKKYSSITGINLNIDPIAPPNYRGITKPNVITRRLMGNLPKSAMPPAE